MRVEGLAHQYANQTALDGVSFEMRSGEILGLLGPNGAGKSTTLRIMAGVLEPDAGDVGIDGVSLRSSPRPYKSKLGYMPDVPPVYAELTVDEYLRFCAEIRGVQRRTARMLADKAKQRCGLVDDGHRLIGTLSKGYQQRVALAQAIVHEPALIILDEPTVGLDPLQIIDIRNLIIELGDAHTVLLSSHQLSEVQAVCDRVQIIDHGRIVLNENVRQLEQRSERLRVRFAAPPTAVTLSELLGDADIEPLEHGEFRIGCTEHDEVTRRLVEASVTQHWDLRELRTERGSLEDVFVSIVTGSSGGSA